MSGGCYRCRFYEVLIEFVDNPDDRALLTDEYEQHRATHEERRAPWWEQFPWVGVIPVISDANLN